MQNKNCLLNFIFVVLILASVAFFCCSCQNTDNKKVQCNVTFNYNDGKSDLTTTEYIVGEDYSLPIPTREGLIFGGWYYNDLSINLSGVWEIEKPDITLNAKWFYSITFRSALTEDVVITLLEGETIKQSDIPVLAEVEGYNMYWEISDFSLVNKNTVVNSVTSPKEFKVYYENVEDVTNLQELLHDENGYYQIFTYGEKYTLFTPEKDGCYFVCWKYGLTAKNISGSAWEYSQDVTLTSEWANSLQITFIQEGWKVVKVDVMEGQTLRKEDIPAVHEEEGYKINWRESDLQKLNNIIEPVSVYADKKPITYHVIFDSDTGYNVQDVFVNYGVEYTLPKATHKNGYYFDGWYIGVSKVNISGKKWYLTSKNQDNTIYLKAHWKCIVTIKYPGLDKPNDEIYVGFGENLQELPKLYVKLGYFVYYEDGYQDKIKGVISNVTINVYEKMKTFVVYYDLSDGSVVDKTGLSYDSKKQMYYQKFYYGDTYQLKSPPKSKNPDYFTFWESDGKYIKTSGTWQYDFDHEEIIIKVSYGMIETPGY